MIRRRKLIGWDFLIMLRGISNHARRDDIITAPPIERTDGVKSGDMALFDIGTHGRMTAPDRVTSLRGTGRAAIIGVWAPTPAEAVNKQRCRRAGTHTFWPIREFVLRMVA